MAATKTIKKDSEGYYQPWIDKNGNGSAVLRFLPGLPGEEEFVQLFNHAFKVEDRWFIENCPSTLNLACPVCEIERTLWIKGNKELVSIRKRKMYFISNVLVVRDPKQAENDGKVFLFKYGKKIFDKINSALNPLFPDTEPMNPFDVEEGANFRLRITQAGKFRDYDKSSFDAPSALGDPEQVEAILSQRSSLAEIIAPQQFKSYDELKAKFDRLILGKAA